MKICLNCSFHNPDDADYCIACGANLLAKPNEKVEPEVQDFKKRRITRTDGTISCPNCGNVYKAKEAKCPYCGTITDSGVLHSKPKNIAGDVDSIPSVYGDPVDLGEGIDDYLSHGMTPEQELKYRRTNDVIDAAGTVLEVVADVIGAIVTK